MVDVSAANEKLRARAQRIVVEATGTHEGTAAETLEKTGWQAKPAIVALLTDVDTETAIRRLHHCGGHVRTALRAG